MVERIKTGTIISIIAALWLGVAGVALRGCENDKNASQELCRKRIENQYKDDAVLYCREPCIRDYVLTAGEDNFRARQLELSEAVDECLDRKVHPEKYDGKTMPGTRYILNRMINNSLERGQ